MNINESINKLLKNMMEEYSKNISEKCNIKQEILYDIWNDMCNDFKLDNKTPTSTKVKTKSKLENKCQAILQRGKRAGEACGKKCEHQFCKIHGKHIVEDLPQDKITDADTIPEKIIIRKNRSLDVLWHPRTRFIFKSKDELIVIGKVTDTDTQIDLEESDIEICKKWKFKYIELKT